MRRAQFTRQASLSSEWGHSNRDRDRDRVRNRLLQIHTYQMSTDSTAAACMYVQVRSTCTPERSPRSPHHPRPREGRGAEYTNYPTKSTNCQKQQHLYCETATQHKNATLREDDALPPRHYCEGSPLPPATKRQL